MLFLDEIGDIPHGADQSAASAAGKGEVTRLGETKPRKINVRVLTATHHNLSQDVARGNLFAPIFSTAFGSLAFTFPAEGAKEDIPLLVTSFLAEGRASMGNSSTGKPGDHGSALMDYHWPGNVRELKSTINAR